MSCSKQPSKVTKRRRKAVSAALGVAGALLATGASASTAPTGNMPAQNAASVILAEEEISDVSLATFYVFDKENAGPHQSGLQLAPEGADTEAAEAAQPTQAAEAVHMQAAEGAPSTEAAEAVQAEAAAVAGAAEGAAAYGLDLCGFASFGRRAGVDGAIVVVSSAFPT
jgi:hypothetical protein